MSFTCERAFTITINPLVIPDVPLQQAIYSSNLGAIVGVRGQYLHVFHPVTGALITTKRIVDDFLFGEASIVEVGAFLYVGLWRRIHDPNDFPGWLGDIYKVTPATLAVTALGLGASITGSGIGFSNLVTDGTYIYGMTGYSKTATGSGIFKVNPLAIGGYLESNVQLDNRNIVDLVWDSAHSTLWNAYGGGPEVHAIYAPGAAFGGGGLDVDVLLVAPPFVCGICYSPANVALYCVGNSATIVKVDAATAVATLPGNYSNTTSSNLAVLAATARPIKIKYNPVDGLIYVPTWAGDTVEVLDPNPGPHQDTIIAIKAGFTSPIDVVFTPAGKKFAVQNSAFGLREII